MLNSDTIEGTRSLPENSFAKEDIRVWAHGQLNGNIIIDTLEKEYFYNNNMSNLTFTMEYNRNIYTSNSFSLNQENIYVDLISNAAVPPLKCHIFRNPVNITIPSPQKFYCDIQDYSISSYEYVFFFRHII